MQGDPIEWGAGAQGRPRGSVAQASAALQTQDMPPLLLKHLQAYRPSGHTHHHRALVIGSGPWTARPNLSCKPEVQDLILRDMRVVGKCRMQIARMQNGIKDQARKYGSDSVLQDCLV